MAEMKVTRKEKATALVNANRGLIYMWLTSLASELNPVDNHNTLTRLYDTNQRCQDIG